MDDKVKYDKVKIQFSDIILTLHEKAVQIAQENNKNIQIFNSAFGETQEKFEGAGEYSLILTPIDDKIEVNEDNKDEYLNFAKDYIKYFVGEDAAKLVSDEDLQPMVDLRDVELSSTEHATGTPTISESYCSISHKEKFINETINRIFEEEESSGGETATEPPSSETGSEKPSDKKPEQVQVCVGFYMTYAIDVENHRRNRHGILNALGKLGKSVFGNYFADLKNIELKTMGGGSIKVGKIFDPSTYGMGFKIDKNTIATEMGSVIRDTFPRSENIRAMVWDTTTLIDALRNQKKLTPEISQKLKSVKYALGVEVQSDDYSYRQITKQKIADLFNEASHLDEKLSKSNLSEKDIILISGYFSKYKFDSGYDKKHRKQSTNTNDGTDNSKSKNNNKKPVSEDKFLDFNDIVVESMICKLFESMLSEAHGKGLDSLGNDDLIYIIKRIPSIKITRDINNLDNNELRDLLEKHINKNNPSIMDMINGRSVSKDVKDILIKNLLTPESGESEKESSDTETSSEKESSDTETETNTSKPTGTKVDLYIIPSKFIDKVENPKK